MKAIATTAVLAASILAVDSAQAASVTTHTLGWGGLANSHSYTTADGVGFTATATATQNGHTTDAKVGEYILGLGVTSSSPIQIFGFNLGNSDSHQIDGKGASETLWFTFDSEYKIDSLLFSFADRNDDVTILDGNGSSLGSYSLSSGLLGFTSLDLSGLDFSGNKIGIAALGSNDGFKVTGFKGHAVPTPSAALAGLVGLIGLAVRRRRHDAAEQA